MKANKNIMWIATILLIVVDVLTFHDLQEAHTTRDWLTLVASVLVFYSFYSSRKG